LAVERFWALMDRWHDSVAAMTPEQLDTPGFGQYPDGSDPDEPFAVVLWWTKTSSSSTTWPRSPSSATSGVPAP
jgi:hypothetical protein